MSGPGNVFEKSLAYSLEIGRIGTVRKINSTTMQLKEGYGDQPDPSAIGVSKEIIQCSEFDAIQSRDGRIRADLARLALPAPFRKGVYLIPLSLVQRVDDMVQAYQTEREALIEAFMTGYLDAINAARIRLGGVFNPADYPDAARVRSAFYVRASYLEMGLPGRLQEINPEIFQRERNAFSAKLESAADEIRLALRESFRDLVDHMADRLTPDPSGKPRIFRDSLVLNLKGFLEDFNARNIADDTDLAALVDQARAALAGRTPEELRNAPMIRDQVQARMSEIKTALGNMITTRPGRKFSFEE
jgi:hypothetical protein